MVARREQGFEKHVEILLAAIDIADPAFRTAQIEFVAASGPRKSHLAQAENEHGAKGNRAHGNERGNGHATRQVVTAAPGQQGESASGQLGRHAIGNRLIVKPVVREFLKRRKEARDDGLARGIVVVEHDVGIDHAAREGQPFA